MRRRRLWCSRKCCGAATTLVTIFVGWEKSFWLRCRWRIFRASTQFSRAKKASEFNLAFNLINFEGLTNSKTFFNILAWGPIVLYQTQKNSRYVFDASCSSDWLILAENIVNIFRVFLTHVGKLHCCQLFFLHRYSIHLCAFKVVDNQTFLWFFHHHSTCAVCG